MPQSKNPLAEIVTTNYSPGPEKMSINKETVGKLWSKIGCIRNRPKKAWRWAQIEKIKAKTKG